MNQESVQGFRKSARRHCEICATPTDGLWMDRPLCDQCLDTMAEDLSADAVAPAVGLSYIKEARARAEEKYQEFADRERW